jgi:hypothetical protein
MSDADAKIISQTGDMLATSGWASTGGAGGGDVLAVTGRGTK